MKEPLNVVIRMSVFNCVECVKMNSDSDMMNVSRDVFVLECISIE